MNDTTTNPSGFRELSFLLAGVGGQGTILASDVVAELGVSAGYDVKKAEVHGMSQRGGSVISHVRWGPQVFSPIIAKGETDIFVAFEKLEAVRFIDHLCPGGLALINNHTISPITVSAGNAVYPNQETIRAALTRVTGNVHWVNGLEIAEKLGNARTANVVILGALSALLKMEADPWLKVIRGRVPPKYIELNRQAFEAGRQSMSLASSPFVNLPQSSP
jgi:indolepyruvate ferredoxin oxidoreductase beta subunit